MNRPKHFYKNELGQSLVEFAVVCTVLLMLAGGVMDGVRVIRYKIILNGAATEIANQISSLSSSNGGVNTICENVLNNNYQNELGDGKTTYAQFNEDEAFIYDGREYHYHSLAYGDWSGARKYRLVRITLERDVELFTPFGRLIFGDSDDNGHKTMTTSAATRVYSN